MWLTALSTACHGEERVVQDHKAAGHIASAVRKRGVGRREERGREREKEEREKERERARARERGGLGRTKSDMHALTDIGGG